jgi:hypothetical protein
MSRFFPHSAYAEDQPLSRTLLSAHILSRAFQTGAVGGLTYTLGARLFGRYPAILTRTAKSALWTTAIFIPGIPLYMWGKTDIEWKDRSWRLLENQGQMEVDDWSSAGFVGGLAVAGWRELGRQATKGRLLRLTGGAAVGDLVGVAGYMVYRYGMHGGKWPDIEVRE